MLEMAPDLARESRLKFSGSSSSGFSVHNSRILVLSWISMINFFGSL
jgi:hypothetical protein